MPVNEPQSEIYFPMFEQMFCTKDVDVQLRASVAHLVSTVEETWKPTKDSTISSWVKDLYKLNPITELECYAFLK